MHRSLLNSIIHGVFNRKSYDDRVSSWEDAANLASGYDSEVILEKVIKGYEISQKKPGAYERDSVVLEDGLINWPLVAMIHWFSNTFSSQVKILDFGGSFASQYFQNERLIRNGDLKWSIVEQKKYVDSAKNMILNQNINFYERIEDCLFKENPNFIFFGGSLQYLEKPYEILNQLDSNDRKVLIIDRIPIHSGDKDIVAIHHVPKNIYDASYPFWIFSERKLKKFLADTWTLVCVFDAMGGTERTRNKLKFSWKGFVYIK